MALETRFSVAILLGTLALFSSCRSRITGNEGNLEFSYVADDDVRDFNKPIAVNAKLELTVAEAGTHKTVELTDAKSSADGVLKVASYSGDKVVLEGVGSGSALISVEAKVPSGSTLPDSVNMLARVPEVLKLSHTCTSELEAQYLVNQEILVPFDMQMKNGQHVIGYGYHPVQVTPADGLALDHTSRDQQFLHFKTAATKQLVTLSSTIDATQVTLVLVQEGEIDGAVLGPGAGSTPTQTGHTGLYHVLPTIGGTPVCQPIVELTAASETPSICDAAAAAANETGQKGEYGWVKVTGKAVGHCNFTVTYPKGKAGAGASATLTVDIVEVVKP